MGAPAKTDVEIDKALTVLAYYGGNSARAGQELGIASSTLRDWRREIHRDRYAEIIEREGPKLEAMAVQQARETIVRSGEIEHSILDLLHAATDEDHEALKPKDIVELAGALQRITTSKGINTDKLMTWTGRPQGIIEHRDPKQAAAALARRLGVTLDSTAEEITDTALLPEKTA
jgi:transposase-like protein